MSEERGWSATRKENDENIIECWKLDTFQKDENFVDFCSVGSTYDEEEATLGGKVILSVFDAVLMLESEYKWDQLSLESKFGSMKIDMKNNKNSPFVFN